MFDDKQVSLLLILTPSNQQLEPSGFINLKYFGIQLKVFFRNIIIMKPLSLGLFSVLMFMSVVIFSSQVNDKSQSTLCLMDVLECESELKSVGEILPFENVQSLLFVEEFSLSQSSMVFFSRHTYYASHFGEIPTPPPDTLFISQFYLKFIAFLGVLVEYLSPLRKGNVLFIQRFCKILFCETNFRLVSVE